MNKPKTSDHYGFPLTNPQKRPSIDIVPDENIGKDSKGLCIGRSNLNFLGSEIMDANLKKYG